MTTAIQYRYRGNIPVWAFEDVIRINTSLKVSKAFVAEALNRHHVCVADVFVEDEYICTYMGDTTFDVRLCSRKCMRNIMDTQIEYMKVKLYVSCKPPLWWL